MIEFILVFIIAFLFWLWLVKSGRLNALAEDQVDLRNQGQPYDSMTYKVQVAIVVIIFFVVLAVLMTAE